ncbi:MAG: GAF domain-containing protein [Chlorobi bacterium]|nr:GAF domain-containing protein [Chlorobiota bacterium]
MNKEKKYIRLKEQIEKLIKDVSNPISRMATINSVLHHKMPGFFWTGFYLLDNRGELIVGPYQGTLACMLLEKNKGVCWAGINSKETVIVDDVDNFEGHIACSSLSKSEIVVPIFDKDENITGVMDVDSREKANFDETDKKFLEQIVYMIYH